MPPKKLTKKEFARALRIHKANGCLLEGTGVCLGPGFKEISQAREEIRKESEEGIW